MSFGEGVEEKVWYILSTNFHCCYTTFSETNLFWYFHNNNGGKI